MTPTLPTSPALVALIQALDAAVHSAHRTPAAVAAALQGHLGDPTLLAPCHRRSAADGYRTNVVHTAPMARSRSSRWCGDPVSAPRCTRTAAGASSGSTRASRRSASFTA